MLCKLGQGECHPTRLSNLDKLNLPKEKKQELENIIENNKIQFEIWIESAISYNALREKLYKRKFKFIPTINKPEISNSQIKLDENVIKTLPNQNVMLQRKTKS